MRDINKEIETYITENIEEEKALLMELGKIPAPSHNEDLRAAFVKEWFRKNGCPDAEIDSAKNVVCKFNCDGCNEITVIMAHMDVVFPDTTPLPMTLDGDILRAPGIGDDTANLTNLMMGMRYLVRNIGRLKTGVMIVANACEEGLGNLDGAKQIFIDYAGRIKEFYSFDGYLGQCIDVPVGSHRMKISVNCQGGHSYLNFGRDNAIQIMAAIIQDLYAIQEPKSAYTTFNVGTIQGGSTVNSIAQHCEMLYEYRSDSEACLQEMKEKMDEVIRKYQDLGKNVTVEVLGIRPGMGAIDKEGFAAWTGQNMEIIRKFWDGEIKRKPGSTDANIPLSKGVFGNTIGTVTGDLAHTREEWIDLTSLPDGLGIVLSVIEQYLEQ